MPTTRAGICALWIASVALIALGCQAVATALPPLEISGNRIGWVNASAAFIPLQLRGLDATGALFACVKNQSIFDGHTDDNYLAAMKSWNADIVRLPMNEDCWLGADYIAPQFSGDAYRTAVIAYVQRLVDYGFYVIFDLHWVRGGMATATQQQPMPDARTPTYWASVSNAFANMSQHVIFDLFNEPYPDLNARDNPAAWACWKLGGVYCPHVDYTAVGFDALVAQVRAAGSQHILMLGGINYANDLDAWVQNMPHDPLGRLAASWHSYATNACANIICWELTIKPVIDVVPVIVGEIGESDCQGSYILPLMEWLDAQATSYLAWVFLPWNCDAGPALISDYNGTCTESFGCTFKDHIAAHATVQLQM